MKQSKINNFFNKNNENCSEQMYDSMSMSLLSKTNKSKTCREFCKMSDPMQLYEKIRNEQRSAKFSRLSTESDNSSQSQHLFFGSQLVDGSQMFPGSSQSEENSSTWYQQMMASTNKDCAIKQDKLSTVFSMPSNEDRNDFTEFLKSNSGLHKQKAALKSLSSTIKEHHQELMDIAKTLQDRLGDQTCSKKEALEKFEGLESRMKLIQDVLTTSIHQISTQEDVLKSHFERQEKTILDLSTQIKEMESKIKTNIQSTITTEVKKIAETNLQKILSVKQDILKKISESNPPQERKITSEASCQYTPPLTLSKCIKESKSLLKQGRSNSKYNLRASQQPKSPGTFFVPPPMNYLDQSGNTPVCCSGLTMAPSQNYAYNGSTAMVPYNKSPSVNPELIIPPATPFRLMSACPVSMPNLDGMISAASPFFTPSPQILTCPPPPMTPQFSIGGLDSLPGSASNSTKTVVTEVSKRSMQKNHVVENLLGMKPTTRSQANKMLMPNTSDKSDVNEMAIEMIPPPKPRKRGRKSTGRKRKSKQRKCVELKQRDTQVILPSNPMTKRATQKQSKAALSVTTYQWKSQHDNFANSCTRTWTQYAYDNEDGVVVPTSLCGNDEGSSDLSTQQINITDIDPFDFDDAINDNIRIKIS